MKLHAYLGQLYPEPLAEQQLFSRPIPSARASVYVQRSWLIACKPRGKVENNHKTTHQDDCLVQHMILDQVTSCEPYDNKIWASNAIKVINYKDKR